MTADTQIVISTELRNVGSSTAHVTEGRVGYQYSEEGRDALPIVPDYSRVGLYDNNITGMIFPGEVRVGNYYPMIERKGVMFSQEQLSKLNSGHANFWIYGYLIYRDTFSFLLGPTSIGFCYSYSAQRLQHCGFEGRNYIYAR